MPYTHTLYWPFLWYVFTADWMRGKRTRGRNYATSYVYKMAFLQYFHLFRKRDSCLIFHLMEKEMVVLCGKILCIWIICVSSHPFSQLPLVCLFTHSTLALFLFISTIMCPFWDAILLDVCLFSTATAAECSLCSFLVGFYWAFRLLPVKYREEWDAEKKIPDRK